VARVFKSGYGSPIRSYEVRMSGFLSGTVRYFVIGFGILGAGIAYLYFCDRVYKIWPRVGIVLGVVVAAVPFALFTAAGATAMLGPRFGEIVFVAAYLLIVLGVLFVQFTKTRP
jgi:hypothetical protein